MPSNLRLALLLSIVLAVSGCTAIADREEPTPTPVPVRADEGKQTYDVQRGSIYDTIKGLGRIVARTDTPLYFKQEGRLRTVAVAVMQPVKKGDLLAELDPGDLPLKLEQARIQMEIAQIEAAKLLAQSPVIRSDAQQAAAAVVSSQAAATRAFNEAAKLEAGATGPDIAVAQAAVEQARANHERAQAQLAGLRRPPAAPEEVIAAQAAVDKARSVLDRAQAEYDRIAWRPGAAGSAQALALQQATADFEQAQATLRMRQQGPRAEDIAAAEQAVVTAAAALNSAEVRLAQVRSGARIEDVRAARLAAEAANQALAATRDAYNATLAKSELDLTTFDTAMAQKRVELARVRYEGLQNDLEALRVRAPYDGVITFVTGKRGDRFEAFAPIAIISDPRSLEVAVEFQGSDVGRISPGQEAVITTEAFGKTEIRGRVVRLPNSADAGASGPLSSTANRSVRLSFEPPGTGAVLGQLAQVTVITQAKDNIILIPNTAVRRFGTRKYVQLLSPDGRRRDVDVETGLVTDTETEITKGLQEGQRVIVS